MVSVLFSGCSFVVGAGLAETSEKSKEHPGNFCNILTENLFGDKLNTALHFLSRAIAGNIEDKNWATYLGNRDCGKGVLYDGLTGAFGDYVKTFELANMMYQRKSSTAETSKTLYWLIDLQFVRLAISQEVPTPEQNMKMDGTMLKKVTGGGDNIVARRNYDREDSHFVLDATFFMLGNNAINVDVKDAYEHCVEFSSVNQFKSQQQIDEILDKISQSGYDALTAEEKEFLFKAGK